MGEHAISQRKEKEEEERKQAIKHLNKVMKESKHHMISNHLFNN